MSLTGSSTQSPVELKKRGRAGEKRSREEGRMEGEGRKRQKESKL